MINIRQMKESRAMIFAYAEVATTTTPEAASIFPEKNRINSSTFAHKLKRNESILSSKTNI